MTFSFKSVLSSLGKLAQSNQSTITAAAASINPIAGALVNMIGPAVANAAANIGATNSQKKASVVDVLEAGLPTLLPLLQQAGVSIVDQTKFATGADTLIEAILQLTQGVGLAPSSTSPTAPIPVSTQPPVLTPDQAVAQAAKLAQAPASVHVTGYSVTGNEITFTVSVPNS